MRQVESQALDRKETDMAYLNEEQIALLNELTAFRHEIHTSVEEIFKSEGTHRLEYEIIDVLICDNALNERIKKAFGKRAFCYICDYIDKACDVYDNDDYVDAEEKEDAYLEICEELHSIAYGQISRINDEIEAFLRAIDNECGTTFCPTGKTRVY
jgi:hypothetical protein